MCAIIGWSGQVSNPLLRDLFKMASPFGPHAVGLVYPDLETLRVYKRAIHPENFLRNCNHRLERASKFQSGLGHTRYGTHGSTADNRNAHPFIHEANGTSYVFVHNGVIPNYRELMPTATVDSECLGPLIANRDTMLADGSVGIAWFEVKPGSTKLFVYRRNQSLSASRVGFFSGENAVIFHSRRGFITEGRFGRDIASIQQINLTEGVAYEVTTSGLAPVWSDSGEYSTQPNDNVSLSEVLKERALKIQKMTEEADAEDHRCSSNYRGG